jgi:hypothetical protein
VRPVKTKIDCLIIAAVPSITTSTKFNDLTSFAEEGYETGSPNPEFGKLQILEIKRQLNVV